MMKRSYLSYVALFAGLCLLMTGWGESVAQAADEPASKTAHSDPEDGHDESGESESSHEGETGKGADSKDHSKEHGEPHPEGPPLSFRTDLALWSFISFIILLVVLRMFAWGPLVDGLDKREANFRNQLAEAEAARKQAERMLQEHAAKLDAVQDEVKAIIDEAKRDAEHTKNDIITEAQKEAKLTQDRAIHEIERSRDAALKELFDTMSSQVASATEQVIGRSLNGDDQTRLIDEALSQFSSQ